MGRWAVESVTGSSSTMETSDGFGNNFFCNFKLTYRPSKVGRFVEPPKLDWHEKFIMIDHHKRERWVFESNMYEHNPTSRTLGIWPRRYLEAYDAAIGRGSSSIGSARLVDKMNQPIRGEKLKRATENGAKADAVRDYLKANGGSLLITIHDIPSISMPKLVVPPQTPGADRNPVMEHKERLLMLDCGVVGGVLRFKAIQYLNVDGTKPKSQWDREATLSWTRTDLPLPRGYHTVPAPPRVSLRRPPIFMVGECW